MRSFWVGSSIFLVDFWAIGYHISRNKKNNLYKKIRNNFQCYYLHVEEIISLLYSLYKYQRFFSDQKTRKRKLSIQIF